jgi:hypothetical protein
VPVYSGSGSLRTPISLSRTVGKQPEHIGDSLANARTHLGYDGNKTKEMARPTITPILGMNSLRVRLQRGYLRNSRREESSFYRALLDDLVMISWSTQTSRFADLQSPSYPKGKGKLLAASQRTKYQ